MFTYIVFYSLLILRIVSVLISGFNERKLKKMGAREFGTNNSKMLIIAHFIYYACCFGQNMFNAQFLVGGTALAGLWLYFIAILILYYVIYELRQVWTVKLFIAPIPYHSINKSWLFRWVKHPNYYLNIIPELIGIALIFHAYAVLLIGMPVYLYFLRVRILQEEKVMEEKFSNY